MMSQFEGFERIRIKSHSNKDSQLFTADNGLGALALILEGFEKTPTEFKPINYGIHKTKKNY